jgi:hypothetical protein
MERGELSADEKIAIESRRVGANGSPIPTEAASDEGGSDKKPVVEDHEEKVKEENVPDGDEKEQEWREGPHKIIERRAGPGEGVRMFVGSYSNSY